MKDSPKKSEIKPYEPSPECKQLREDIMAYYAKIIPDNRMAFARFVYDQGNGALAPIEREGKQETWQAVGRRLYGPKFMEDLKAVIEEKRVVATQ